MLPATLAARLGVGSLVDQTVALGERPGAANPGAKILTLISAMALGADCIDDCDLLRCGRTGQLLAVGADLARLTPSQSLLPEGLCSVCLGVALARSLEGLPPRPLALSGLTLGLPLTVAVLGGADLDLAEDLGQLLLQGPRPPV